MKMLLPLSGAILVNCLVARLGKACSGSFDGVQRPKGSEWYHGLRCRRCRQFDVGGLCRYARWLRKGLSK
jgi:hypothetical protein